jgi:hypothetical protein
MPRGRAVIGLALGSAGPADDADGDVHSTAKKPSGRWPNGALNGTNGRPVYRTDRRNELRSVRLLGGSSAIYESGRPAGERHHL